MVIENAIGVPQTLSLAIESARFADSVELMRLLDLLNLASYAFSLITHRVQCYANAVVNGGQRC